MGPGYKTWDTSLVKQFPVSEQKHLEFRAEFFNVLNHVNYLVRTVWRDQRRTDAVGTWSDRIRIPAGSARSAADPVRAEVLFLRRVKNIGLKFYF